MRRLAGKVASFSSISSSSACSPPLTPEKKQCLDVGQFMTPATGCDPIEKYKTCSCEVLKDPSSKEKSGDKDGDYGVSVPDISL